MRAWLILIGVVLVINLGLFLYGVRGDLPGGSAAVESPPGRGVIRIAGEDREPPFARGPLDLAAMHARSKSADRSTAAELAVKPPARPPASPALASEPPPPASEPPPPALASEPPPPEVARPEPPVVPPPVPDPPAAAVPAAEIAQRPASPPLVAPLCGELSIFGPGPGATRILLDNFSIDDLSRAVDTNDGYGYTKAELEASGNITLESIRDVALTGVDYISTGAITKNIEAIDLSMLFRID